MAKKTKKFTPRHLTFNVWLKTRELHMLDDAYDEEIKNYMTAIILFDEGSDDYVTGLKRIDTLRENYIRERNRIKAELRAEQAKQEVIEADADTLATATAITLGA